MKKSFIIASAIALFSTGIAKAQSTLISDNVSIGTQFTSTFIPDFTKLASFQNEPNTSNGVFIHNSGSTTMGDKNTENTKALLELSSNNKGFLPTRLTTEEINALNAGASEIGMLVYDTTKKCLSEYNGTNWGCVGAASGLGIVYSKRFDLSANNAATEEIIFDNLKIKFVNNQFGSAIYPYIATITGTQKTTIAMSHSVGSGAEIIDEAEPAIYTDLNTTFRIISANGNIVKTNTFIHDLDINVNDHYYQVKWWPTNDFKDVYVVVTKFH